MPFRYSQFMWTQVIKSLLASSNLVITLYQNEEVEKKKILRVKISVQLLKIGDFVWNMIYFDMQLYV